MLLFNHQLGSVLESHPNSPASVDSSPSDNLYIDGIGVPRYLLRLHLAVGIRLASVPPPGRERVPSNLAREALNADVAARFTSYA